MFLKKVKLLPEKRKNAGFLVTRRRSIILVLTTLPVVGAYFWSDFASSPQAGVAHTSFNEALYPQSLGTSEIEAAKFQKKEIELEKTGKVGLQVEIRKGVPSVETETNATQSPDARFLKGGFKIGKYEDCVFQTTHSEFGGAVEVYFKSTEKELVILYVIVDQNEGLRNLTAQNIEREAGINNVEEFDDANGNLVIVTRMKK